MAADDKAYYNYRTNVYLKALDTVYQSNTTAGTHTESEDVYLAEDEIFIRHSYKGIVINNDAAGKR